MTKKPRELAVDILKNVDQKRAHADRLLDAALRRNDLDSRDRALLTELVYGTLRWRGRLDWVAQRFLPQSLDRMNPYVRNVLRLALYQLLFLSRIPEYAAVDEAVTLAKRYAGQRSGGLANAVLRRVLRDKGAINLPSPRDDPLQHLAVHWSHPEWLVQLWTDYFDAAEIPALLAANNEESYVSLRVNSLRADRQALLKTLESGDFKAVPSPWSDAGIRLRSGAVVEALPGYRDGLFQVQGEASQLVSCLLNPQPHEQVLDACAAPGGKTTHLAELMRDEGQITAVDPSARGLEKVRENVQRLGLRSVNVFRVDITEGLPDECPAFYDRILVDAPCSGLGTLRSNPEAKWQRTFADIKRLAGLQRSIMQQVVGYLKPGGVMVYATCTLSGDENESVVTDFLQHNTKMALEDAGLFLPEKAKTMTRNKFFLALPHKHDTDGFFAARMRKVA